MKPAPLPLGLFFLGASFLFGRTVQALFPFFLPWPMAVHSNTHPTALRTLHSPTHPGKKEGPLKNP
jgi:hypothetical protein